MGQESLHVEAALKLDVLRIRGEIKIAHAVRASFQSHDDRIELFTIIPSCRKRRSKLGVASTYHEERVGGLDEALLLVLELLELRRRVEQVDVVLQHHTRKSMVSRQEQDRISRSTQRIRIERGRALWNERISVPSWRRVVASSAPRVEKSGGRRRGQGRGLGLYSSDSLRQRSPFHRSCPSPTPIRIGRPPSLHKHGEVACWTGKAIALLSPGFQES
jgi:hypothetical protein